LGLIPTRTALALATALTVLLIAYAYSRIIEQFPLGGGGYVVATRLLGRKAGLTSGSALVIALHAHDRDLDRRGRHAIFSLLPHEMERGSMLGFLPSKLLVEVFAVVFLIMLNLRGSRSR